MWLRIRRARSDTGRVDEAAGQQQVRDERDEDGGLAREPGKMFQQRTHGPFGVPGHVPVHALLTGQRRDLVDGGGGQLGPGAWAACRVPAAEQA